MKIKESPTRKFFLVINAILLLALVFVTLYPMLHVLFASFSDGNLLMAHSGVLLKPIGFNIESYKKIIDYPMFLRSYFNTLYIVVMTLALNFVLTAFGAYFLSRKNISGQKVIMIMILLTMYFNGGLIPTYMNIRNLNLYNSHLAIILPGAINTFNLIILKTSFGSVPESLCESAKLDGASHFRILFSIILPLAKSSLAVVILYYAVAHWNAWFNAMIFLEDRELFPLQLILREILLMNDTSGMMTGVLESDVQAVGESLKYAVIIMATVPILCVYPFLQRYFAKGTMVGAIKE